MQFIPTKNQLTIFRLAAIAFEKLGEQTSKNLDSLGCSTMQLDGYRGHVKAVQEQFSKDVKANMGAAARIAVRAALELHKRDTKALEKKNEQLEFDTDEQEERVQAIEEFLSDIDEQLELHPDDEPEEDEKLVSLDDYIAAEEKASENAEAFVSSGDDASGETITGTIEPLSAEHMDEPLDEDGPSAPGSEWMANGRSYIRGRDGRAHDITDMPEKQRKNLRRSIVRKSRAKSGENVNSRKGAKRK